MNIPTDKKLQHKIFTSIPHNGGGNMITYQKKNSSYRNKLNVSTNRSGKGYDYSINLPN
jgi:hypothetical protein